MSALTLKKSSRAVLIGGAALILTACSSAGSYRVASIGDVQSGNGGVTGDSGGDTGAGKGSGGTGTGSGTGTGTGTGTGSGSGSGGSGAGTGNAGGQTSLGTGVLVSAGNAVIGLAGKHDGLAGRINGTVPALAPVTGTVTAVLRDTGQTLVSLGSGQTVALNSVTGIVGEVVKLDLGSRTVVSAADGSSLLGVGLLSPAPASGALASVNVGTGTTLASGNVVGSVVGTVATVVNAPLAGVPATTGVPNSPSAVVPAVTTVANTVTGALPAVTGVVNTVTGALPLGGIVAGTGVLAGGSVGVTNGNQSGGATGVVGLKGLLGAPKP